MNLFQKNKYLVIKEAISKDLATFLYNYFGMKRQVAKSCFDAKFISPYETILGTWTDEQIPNTYAHYSDIAMETLMLKCQPIMEKTTGLKLYPAYTYARIYKKGIKVDLKPGDMLVYKGTDLEHWRTPFKGKDCAQVFLHYNNQKTPGSKENMFDKRPHLGLPSGFNR